MRNSLAGNWEPAIRRACCPMSLCRPPAQCLRDGYYFAAVAIAPCYARHAAEFFRAFAAYRKTRRGIAGTEPMIERGVCTNQAVGPVRDRHRLPRLFDCGHGDRPVRRGVARGFIRRWPHSDRHEGDKTQHDQAACEGKRYRDIVRGILDQRNAEQDGTGNGDPVQQASRSRRSGNVHLAMKLPVPCPITGSGPYKHIFVRVHITRQD